jgi:2-(1,2-epoxy-1,2-dihydrophenyl)acetyl-CoA isomerase
MKKVLNQSLYSNLDQMLEQEADNQNELGRSSDAAEGVMAFLTKRSANFSGQ